MVSCLAAASIILSSCGGHVDNNSNNNSTITPTTSAQVPCETLTNVAIPAGIVQSAQSIATGSYTRLARTPLSQGFRLSAA
ncbi:hypothetical protein SAMN02787142_7535 [Burkholderia sp. WP9]|nr:hypothetical protein SAMN02787142_7535 [Burkholderia sp. WP9]